MSSCRCGEISGCRSRIEVLKSAEERLDGCAGGFASAVDKVTFLEVQTERSFETDSMEKLRSLIGKQNTYLEGTRNGFREKLHYKQQELSRELGSMQQEDAAYHEEERRREEEEQARAASAAASRKK